MMRAALCRDSKKALFCFVLLRSEGAFLASEALEKGENNLNITGKNYITLGNST